MPYGVTRFRSEAFQQRLAALMSSRRYDAVYCETPYLAVNLPESLAAPLILDTHNVEHRLLFRYLPLEKNPLKRSYARIEGTKMAAWERQVFSRSDLIIACSEDDATEIRQMSPGRPVVVVPNSIDVLSYVPGPAGDNATVLYLGGMDWFPNRDAVEYFATKILPLVHRSLPGVKFRVAGRSPSPEFRQRFDGMPQVEFTGTLPDLRPAIASSTMVVVPLRVGSGTRFKILEAAAMEKPMVSTTLGAEGLDFADGKELIVADDPSAFAAAVVGVLTDPERGSRLGRAARQQAEERYSFRALMTSLRDMLDHFDALGHGGARAAVRPEGGVVLR
jgi:glycosyltransferase involved in cell wall biosynthesis